jgi:hypothetical protein
MSFQDVNCVQNGHSKKDPEALNGHGHNSTTQTVNDVSGAKIHSPVKGSQDDNFSLGGDKNRTEPLKE